MAETRAERMAADARRLQESIEGHAAMLESILRLHPDPPGGQGDSGGAAVAKARLRSQIERCRSARAELLGLLAHEPVAPTPMKRLRFKKDGAAPSEEP